jgi:glycosyltransferase involved in cell wall biosynthesis
MNNLGIVIPALNAAKTLPHTLAALAPLRDAGTEIVLVDSQSTDGTRKLAVAFGIPYLDVPRGNMYFAINAGFERMDREWLTYVNADDILFPDAVGRALGVAGQAAEVVYGSVDFVDQAGRHLHSWNSPAPADLPLLQPFVMPIPQLGTCFRRSVFERLGGFDVRYRYSADYDFFLRAQLAGVRFQRLREPRIGAFRLHSGQITHQRAREMAEEVGRIRGKAGLRPRSLSGRLSYLRYRLCNWDSYLVRAIRNRHVYGKLRLRNSVAH